MPLPNTPYILSTDAWEFITAADYPAMRDFIGIGPTDTLSLANLNTTSASLNASTPFTINQTWDQASTLFTALRVNASSTNSLTTSRLLDLQTGGASKFSVDRTGNIRVDPNNVSAYLAFIVGSNTAFEYYGGNGWGDQALAVRARAGLNIDSTIGRHQLLFAGDTILVRDSSSGNTLALRNGAAAQTFNVYGTSTASNANYARLALTCGLDGNATISTQALGTGTAGTVSINGVPVGRGSANLSTNIAIGGGLNSATSTGIGNIALGVGALSNVTIGPQNIAIGTNVLNSQTIWGYNIGIGLEALFRSTTGASENVAIGIQALYHNQTGFNSVAVGSKAGQFTSVENNTGAVSESIFLGAYTKALSAGQTNQIVIGYNATGIGSNSVVLGNDSITKTALKGNVGIGTTAPTAPLEIRATAGTNVRESLLKCTVSDSGNDAFHIYNGTIADGRFSPGFSGSVFSGAGVAPCAVFAAQTTAVNDTGTTPLMYFQSRITSSETDPNNGTLSVVNTRPLFTWTNFTTTYMQMAANGNLGIGTTTPSEKLHVLGGKVLFGDATDSTGTAGNGELTLQAWRAPQLNIVCNQSSSNFIGLNIKVATTTLAGLLVNSASGEVKIGGLSTGGYFPTFYSNNAEIMRFSTGGYVGIGTTLPTSKLHVAETWNAPVISVTGASGDGVTATITFATQPEAIPVGTTVVIAGIVPSPYNGTFIVTASTRSSISYANATTTTYVLDGTVQRQFAAMKVNVTDTASESISKLLDLQVGGVSQVSVEKSGNVNFGPWLYFSPSGNSPRFSTRSGSNIPIYLSSGGDLNIGLTNHGDRSISIGGFNNGARLHKDANHVLALRDGAAAQSFRVYKTYENAGVDYERFAIDTTASAILLTCESAGTGISRNLVLRSNAELFYDGTAHSFRNAVAGGTLLRWAINSSGHFIAGTDNTYDIGLNATTGGNRPRNVFVADSVFVGTTNVIALGSPDGGILNWNNRANIMSPSTAIIRLVDNPRTNFNLLQFGGAAGFPGLKRVGSELQVVAASTTSAMNVAAVDADLTFIEDRYRRKGTGDPNGVVTAPVGAVYHRTDGGANTSFYVKETGTDSNGWVGK